jgi:hypothetical protein
MFCTGTIDKTKSLHLYHVLSSNGMAALRIKAEHMHSHHSTALVTESTELLCFSVQGQKRARKEE